MPSELDKILEQYENDIRELTNIKPQQFDILKISTMITRIPQRKWNAAQSVVNGTISKKTAEKNAKTIRATKMLSASRMKTQKGLSSAEDRRAFVDNDEEVQAADLTVIEAEAELLAAKLGYECLDDLFTAGKKIMDYLTEQDKAQRQYDRFVDEGNRGR